MDQLPQQLVNGLWQGSVLALFAMGYTLVFGVLDVVNLAHGATYMWGAFIGLLCVTRLGWPLELAIPAAMAGAGLLAVLLDRLAFKPLRVLTVGGGVMWLGALLTLAALVTFQDAFAVVGALVLTAGALLDYRTLRPRPRPPAPHLAPMIASIGASIVLISLARGRFGTQIARFPSDIFPDTPYPLPGNAVIAPIQLTVLAVALVLMLALGFLITRTQLGRALRASAFSERTALLLGIPVDRVIAQTFWLSGALAGAAGVLLGLAFNRLDPTMGDDIELAGLVVIIVGGMGSIAGAALAAFLVGMLRVLSVGYLDSSFRDVFVFGLLILVLLVRPSGIFGKTGA